MKIGRVIKKIEATLNVAAKIGVFLTIIGALAILAHVAMQPEKGNITSPTVMITSMTGDHGGSGVVINRTKSSSLILTNRHVCNILAAGGFVITTTGGRYLVQDYMLYDKHDLCTLSVAADLKFAAKMAHRMPVMYDESIVSGHPYLLPNVITRGHFSGNQTISVLVEWRECVPADVQNQQADLICALFGRVPVIQTFETTLITSLIMPGSSGSAVYNKDQKLSGLVFAGTGGLSFAYIVPYNYILDFLYGQSRSQLKIYKPDYRASLNTMKPEVSQQEVAKTCQTASDDEVKKICKLLLQDVYWQPTL